MVGEIRERESARDMRRGEKERGRMRERSAHAKGERWSDTCATVCRPDVRCFVTITYLCVYAGTYIGTSRAMTDQHREPIQDVSLVTGVGLEWKRRSAAPKGADAACSGLGEPYHCTRNGNDVLIDPSLFCWPGRLPRPSEARDVRESFRSSIRYFAINAAIRAN